MDTPSPSLRAALFWVALAAALLSPGGRRAQACAVCACGDPTLTAMGAEQPFKGRSRGALDVAHRRLLGPEGGQDPERLEEWVFTLSMSHAISSRIQLMVALPTVERRAEYQSLRALNALGLGDAEVRTRVALLDVREGRERHLLTGILGVKLPTGPQLYTEDGAPLPSDLWAGTGSTDALLGASYGYFEDPLSAWVAAWAEVPSPGRMGLQQAPTALMSGAVQYQPRSGVSIRAGLDARAGGALSWEGELEAGTGGKALFGGGQLLVSPAEDLILIAGLSWPLYLSYPGEGPLTSLGVVYDF